MKTVLQKIIADSGHCSRRQAGELISAGRVELNGRTAQLGDRADKGDVVKIDGNELVLSKENIYIKLNKPVGYTCTSRKFKGEKNVFNLVDTDERLFVAGRLDKNSRGLVILTNDGEFANKLTHPRFEHEKKYIVELKVESRKLQAKEVAEKFNKGVDIGEGDGIVKAKKTMYLGNNKFEVVLGEGKKRQIRRMFKVLGYEVVDLLRVSMGNIKLGDLDEGAWESMDIKYS